MKRENGISGNVYLHRVRDPITKNPFALQETTKQRNRKEKKKESKT